jgi:multiple sugar transport system ATP-binding protein
MAEVRIERIVKAFGPVRAVDDVSLTIHDKEFLVLLGPSGCGKTTLLRMIAGLEEPTAGEIFIDDELVNFTAPKDRDISMVFQNYALYPHMDVTSNIALGLKLHHTPKQIITARLNEAAEWLQLSTLLKRYPRQHSVGHQQRVSLGRSDVRDPNHLLMDEPLSNLDARLRVNMRTELIKLHRQLGATIVYVTHDQSEAMTMATRVAIMRSGVIQQLAPPLEVYRHPANKYVATFMGNPEMNFLEVTSEKSGDTWTLTSPTISLPVSDEHGALLAAHPGNHFWLGIRPEALSIAAPTAEGIGIPAVVDVVSPMGPNTLVYVLVDGSSIVADVSSDIEPAEGENVKLTFEEARTHLFDFDTELALW